ncbi:hypothetical protein FB567DRAFT_620568 [Paraphoma chrysanthemicola]|uniref:Uncharacterized protein n=1 Tax=Paraphoma chrysanthemicola TaxID=798071 RepID=A0A8K0RA04_9PLEO|nr:hypothetical protein FB567DRAFT_620568 [Paraphoma chrysanthemicola]
MYHRRRVLHTWANVASVIPVIITVLSLPIIGSSSPRCVSMCHRLAFLTLQLPSKHSRLFFCFASLRTRRTPVVCRLSIIAKSVTIVTVHGLTTPHTFLNRLAVWHDMNCMALCTNDAGLAKQIGCRVNYIMRTIGS